MATMINKTREILEKLNKSQEIVHLNTKEDIERINRTNDYMKNVRRDYQAKEAESQISAASVILVG
jgi:flagellin-specific chaperone FliS